MKTIEQSVIDAFAGIVSSGKIEAAIEAQLNKTITEAVNEHLRGYSDFGKQLSAVVKAALNVNIDHLDLPCYNDMIIKVVRAQVSANINNVLAKQVERQLTELLEPAPKEIKLSTLIADFIKSNGNDGCSCDVQEKISLHIIRSDGLTSGYSNIYMDKENGKSKYSCDIQFGVTDKGSIYALKVDETEIGKTMFIGPIYGFDRDLIQMYAAGTTLIIDGNSEDDFDTYYPGHD